MKVALYVCRVGEGWSMVLSLDIRVDVAWWLEGGSGRHVLRWLLLDKALPLSQASVQIDFREGDLLAPFAGARVDILVSNPPYIPAADIAGLQQEVRDHEPRMALDGGPDGLAPYRIMLEQLALLPAPPQIIGFELGQGQARDIAALLETAGHWPEIIIVPDLAGIERHVLGVRTSEQVTKM